MQKSGDKINEALTNTELTLPGQLDLAVGYSVTESIYVELDATYTQWSVVKELDLRFSSLGQDCGEGCSPEPFGGKTNEKLRKL